MNVHVHRLCGITNPIESELTDEDSLVTSRASKQFGSYSARAVFVRGREWVSSTWRARMFPAPPRPVEIT